MHLNGATCVWTAKKLVSTWRVLEYRTVNNMNPTTNTRERQQRRGKHTAQHNSRQVQVYVSNENIFGLLWRRRRQQRCVLCVYSVLCDDAQYWYKWFCALLRSLFVYIFLSLSFSLPLLFPRNRIREWVSGQHLALHFELLFLVWFFRCCCHCHAMNFCFYFVFRIQKENTHRNKIACTYKLSWK